MKEDSDSEVSSSLNWDEFIGHGDSDDLVSSLLAMYDTLIGSPTSELPHLAPLSALGPKSLDPCRRKSVTAPRLKADTRRSPTNPHPERKRPPDPPPAPPQSPPLATPLAAPLVPPPAPPHVPRPLSVSSMASLSSTSSSSVSSCGHIARIRRTGVVHNSAYLASVESLEAASPGRGVATERRPRSKCDTLSSTGSGDSGVCSPCSFISSPSAGTRPRYCDPQLSYTDRVVMEIVETEGVYVSDLQQIIVGYLERWRSSPECLFTEQQLNDLFSNIRDIFHFNKSFLRDLEQCGLDPVKIAQSFVRNNEGFSVYTDYCTNYPRTMSVLTELMRQEAAAQQFRERQIALQHTLPLGSYLLKPVQRILKYHLLLNNIVKQCSPERPGYAHITHALATMTSIAQHINLMKRRHEHAVRVQEIQSLLLGWAGEDLTRAGELWAEGAFRMAGAKALRHAFLFDRMLLITKKKEEGVLGYKAHIMCSNLMLIESVPGEPLSFHVIPFDNPKYQYTLQARNLEQKREWCLQLKKVILENYNAVIPSHARQLVMQLGQHKAGDEEPAEKHWTPRRQHSAPEYLERRKQDKSRRKSELCLLRTRLQPRASRRSDVGVTAAARQDISRGVQAGESAAQAAARDGEPAQSAGPCSDETSPLPSSASQAPTPRLEQDEGGEGEGEEQNTLETIISALLMQNGEFLKFVNKTRRQPRRRVPNTSEDEEGDYDNLAWPDSPRMRRGMVSPVPSPKLVQRSGLVRRAHSFSSRETDNSSPGSSLSRFSLDQSGAETHTSLWVKHQAVAEGNKKSDSLPRSFQIGGAQSPDWSVATRPITIASDKAQELNLVDMENYINRAEAMCAGRRGNCFPTNLEYTTEEETSVSDLSSHQLYVHPEYRIYKSGLSKTMLRHVINKISSLRSTETLHHPEPRPAPSPCYMQGSPRLGARIAHGSDSSDYADPRTLFPAITPSRKAASVLGIRPCTGSSLSVAAPLNGKPQAAPARLEDDTSDSVNKASEQFDTTNHRVSAGKEADKSNPLKQINETKLHELRLKLSQTRIDGHGQDKSQVEEDACSVGSADSFYERSFEAIETVEAEMFRDSAVFSDQEDAFSDDVDLRIPPPREFDTLPPSTAFESKSDAPLSSHSRTEQHITPTEHAPVSARPVEEQSTPEEAPPGGESHKFRGECDVSGADKRPQSKLDICKPRRDKLCIVKPLMSFSNPLDLRAPRSKKLIQISKVSLNSIPDLEIRYSEKYIKGEEAVSKSCQCSPKPMQSRRHSCKSVDSSSFFTTCHKCKPSRTDVMSKSCDFGFASRESCRDCIHCASRDVVCSACCSLCSVASEDSSRASTVVEVSPTRRGWVKHVVNRLQSF